MRVCNRRHPLRSKKEKPVRGKMSLFRLYLPKFGRDCGAFLRYSVQGICGNDSSRIDTWPVVSQSEHSPKWTHKHRFHTSGRYVPFPNDCAIAAHRAFTSAKSVYCNSSAFARRFSVAVTLRLRGVRRRARLARTFLLLFSSLFKLCLICMLLLLLRQ